MLHRLIDMRSEVGLYIHPAATDKPEALLVMD